MKNQDILGNEDRINTFFSLIDQYLVFQSAMKRAETSTERWKIVEDTFKDVLHRSQITKNRRNLIEEIEIYMSQKE